MGKQRLEAFSDGVIAIIITIMVLELKVPHTDSLTALLALWPVFLSYVLSFVFVGIYWNNHHHLFQAINRVNGKVLWANLHLLFWLSLIPFVTGWMGENHFTALPVAMYGFVLFFAGLAYNALSCKLIAHHGKDSLLAVSLGRNIKGKLSLASYLLAVPLAFFSPLGSCFLYVFVALMWFIPDSRIEKAMQE